MAEIFRDPLIVTPKPSEAPYPVDLRTLLEPAPLVLVTAPPPPILWAASQL